MEWRDAACLSGTDNGPILAIPAPYLMMMDRYPEKCTF